MFNSIKRFSEMNKAIGKVPEEFDENGLLTIKININDDSSFLSPFSYGDNVNLSNDSAAFLDGALLPKNFNKNLHLKIFSDVIDEKERLTYTQALHNHYRQNYIAEKQNIRRDKFISLFMLLASLVFLGAIIIANHLNFNSVVIEILDIIAWVFMWEATDIFFLQRKVSILKQHRNISFYNAKVTFLPLSA